MTDPASHASQGPDARRTPTAPRPAFAHASEAELARILDFYDVRWAYEPDTFPIGWNLDGEVVESFSPDFYLPDLELYVELTTLKQKLVRKKNRKLRRLRELYPDVRIKLFYARDFRMLLLKFGRLALVDELTGTTGQVASPHALDAAAGEPEVVTASAEAGVADVPAARPGPDGIAAARPAEAAIVPADAGTGPGEVAAPPVRLAEMRGRRRGRRRRGRGTDRSAAGASDATAIAAPGSDGA